MKRFLGLIVFALITLGTIAQAPQKFSYQAVARNSEGVLLQNSDLTIRIGILQNDALIWQEDHEVHTNQFGLFSVQIGNPEAKNGVGSVGSFQNINWGDGNYNIDIQVDDGNGFSDMGNSELLSVPFALYAASGTEGPVGEKGDRGEQGIQGEKGDKGERGEQGIQGLIGPKGDEGDRGEQGIQGIHGLKGDKGEQGDQGEQGTKGDPGTGLNNKGEWVGGTNYNPGDYVFSRSTDDPSRNSMWILEDQIAYNSTTIPFNDPDHWIEFEAPEGPQGEPGEKGDIPTHEWNGSELRFENSDGSWGVSTDLIGAQGIQGEQGIKGDKGEPGDQGIPGEKGDQGEQGIQGVSGLKGDKGDQGEQGIQGITGEQGIQGLQGLSGDIPDHQWWFTEVQFENPDGSWGNYVDLKGEQGVQGEQGIPGEPGPKGDQGQQGIPGDRGVQGEQGIQGIPGEKGDQGIQGVQGIPGDPASDDQTLSLAGKLLSISGGNNVDLSPIQDGVNDADADPDNEIQTLTISDHTIILSDGGAVTVPDNVNDADSNPTNEYQYLSIIGHSLSINHGNTITLPDNVIDADADPANELQGLNEVISRNNSANNSIIINLADPVNAQDAATKAYVDRLEAEIDELRSMIENPDPDPEVGPIVDTDGNTYQVVKIGTQWWMAENLKRLPSVSPKSSTSETVPLYYVNGYNGTNVYEARDHENYSLYGVLYNWPAAMISCPEGWHLPSDDDWKTMELFLGMPESEVDILGYRGFDEGEKLKATSGWNDDGNGTNETGFTALPGGNFVLNPGSRGSWWTSTSYEENRNYVRDLYYSNKYVGRGHAPNGFGQSVRCIKD